MKKMMMLMVLATAVQLTACGPDGGQSMASSPDASAGADARPPTTMEGLLGTWRYTAGAVNGTCSDGSPLTASASGTETFSAGSEANTMVVTDDQGCAETCVVSGNIARCSSEDACKGNSVTSDAFTLSGNELREIASGQVTLDDGTTCDVSLSGGALARVQ